MIVRTVLLAFAIVIFTLLALTVIDTEVLRWEWAGLGIGFAAFLPWTR